MTWPANRTVQWVLAVMAIGVLWGGSWFYRYEEREVRRAIEDELVAVAELKAGQVTQWRRERMADAELIRATPYAARRAVDAMAQPQSRTTREMFTGWLDPLMRGGPYSRALLLDPAARTVLVHPPDADGGVCDEARRVAGEVVRSRAIGWVDLHREGVGGRSHLGLVVPFVVRREPSREHVPAAGLPPAGDEETAAVLVLDTPVEGPLMDMLGVWPSPSPTSETLLVRREADFAVVLNPPRHGTHREFEVRLPVSATNRPAVMAVLGRRGLVEGRDYRGESVLAVITPVPGSGWMVVAKTDEAEVLNAWRTRARVILGLLLGGLGCLAGLAVSVWQHDRASRLRTLSAKLAKVSARWARMFSSNAVGVVLADARGGLLEVNDYYLSVLGFSREEFVAGGIRWDERTPSEHLPADLRAIAELRERGICDPYEKEYVRKDGSRVWVLIADALMPGEDEEILAIVLDITARKRSEARVQRLLEEVQASRQSLLSVVEDQRRTAEALLASETSYRRLFEANPHPMWVYDLETLRFLAVNDSAVARYGYSREEFQAMSLEDIRPAEDVPLLRENLERSHETVQESGIWRHRIRSGEVRLVEIASHAIGWHGKTARVVLAHDVTERERAREELQASEDRFRRAVDQSPFPIMLHAEDGTVLLVSRSWCEITGYGREDLATVQDWVRLAYRESGPAVQTVIDQLYGLAGRVEEGDFTIRTRAGEARVWQFSSAPLGRLADGRRLAISMAMDVTERRQAEARVRGLAGELEARVCERTAQLEATNRELEAFSYSVSHDLRAPLRAVNGYARILREDHSGSLDAEGLRLLGVVQSEALRMGRLIDDLLRFSRLGRLPVQTCRVDMRALAAEVYEGLAANDADRVVEFHLGALPPADGDPALLRQVWVNLLDNALKYTRRRERAVISVGGCLDRGMAIYHVRDNGAGFDMRHAGQIFGVFQRLHDGSEYEGTGVGLALVQRILHRHGGQIRAEAEPDRGATFLFTLPAVALLSGASIEAEALGSDASRPPRT